MDSTSSSAQASHTTPSSIQKLLPFINWALIAIAIGLAIYLRVHTFFKNTSLFIDEANVASNVYERGIFGFWQQLDYAQFAPPIFMSILKTCCGIFGYYEQALRLFPFLCSIAGIFLLYKLGKQLLKRPFLIALVILIFGLNFLTVLQACSIKQYTSDLLITLGLTLLTLDKNYERFFNKKSLIKWAILGSVLVWSSMPVVFVLAAVGAYYAWQASKEGDFFRWLPWFSLPVIVWVVNFGLYFFLLLHADASKDSLQQYHEIYVLIADLSESGITHNWNVIKGLLQSYLNAEAPYTFFFLALYGLGSWRLIRTDFAKYLLLVIPFALALFSSILGYYSLIPRLVLFTFPVQLMIMAIGLDSIFDELKATLDKGAHFLLGISIRLLQGATLLVCLSLAYCINGWGAVKPGGYTILMEQTREAINFIAETRQGNQPIFVNYEGEPALRFYTKYYEDKARFENCKEYTVLKYEQSVSGTVADKARQVKPTGVWLLYGHTPNHLAEEDIRKTEAFPDIVIKENFSAWRAKATLFQHNMAQ